MTEETDFMGCKGSETPLVSGAGIVDQQEVRRFISERVVLAGKERASEKTYGLVAVKPEGMSEEVAQLVEYVFSLPADSRRDDEIVGILVRGMDETERRFFLDRVANIDLKMSGYGDYSSSDSFWTASYSQSHGEDYWYSDLLKGVNKGTLCFFVLETGMPEEELERWLDLFKGRLNLVRESEGGGVDVVKEGKGIRGMFDARAVFLTQERLQSILGGDFRSERSQVNVADEVLFNDLPAETAAKIWVSLNEEEKCSILASYVHATGKSDEVWEGIVPLIRDGLGSSVVSEIEDVVAGGFKRTGLALDVCDKFKLNYGKR